ncbi:glycosyltransferase family 2 protein [Pediococcus stilesii]|uniref:EpsI protein n=1 Tax=Pediococcus stilesii TaxID=331679 RepID=A0A0R2L5J9_9LACO|nr:glycosyltransferase family 2 protein [Pediococcus stilesii]KRN94732.1 EpsI protein [Pediococcus stilesii]
MVSSSTKQPKISLIFPVYNAEKYIEKTFSMVKNQTYKNLKIIVVDDGSSDNSLNILQRMAVNNDNIVVLEKKNGGLSSARNYGLQYADTDYVTFVDADDYIDSDYVETLIAPFLIRNNVAISTVKYFRTDTYSSNYFTKTREIKFLKRDSGFNKLLLQSKGYDVSTWAKMYKTSLFKKIKFLDGITYEDFEIIPKLFSGIEEKYWISFIDAVKYQYIRTPNSIITADFKKRDLDILSIVSEGLPFIDNALPESRDAYLSKAIAGTFSVYRKAIRSNATETDIRLIYDKLRWLLKEINIKKGLTKKEIVAYATLLFGKRLSIPITRLLSRCLKEG